MRMHGEFQRRKVVENIHADDRQEEGRIILN